MYAISNLFERSIFIHILCVACHDYEFLPGLAAAQAPESISKPLQSVAVVSDFLFQQKIFCVNLRTGYDSACFWENYFVHLQVYSMSFEMR